ncbi:Uncharacterized protein PECH_005729 [Penicillium ucsense]|uniref:Uncharacterized protein n=1 Tax=Penicillium ucsense TaxID=2839758 RepID=A0A8J8W202_9EURO|nr:Uncharacterized protein PECM_006253 [Penicillium ucsense]KAF7736143.1 Uncharacterized protein PECH_005729 [Penicillium ucsense]
MAVNKAAHPFSSLPQSSPAEHVAKPEHVSRVSDQSAHAPDSHSAGDAGSDHVLPISSSAHGGLSQESKHNVGPMLNDETLAHQETRPPFQPFFTLIQDAHTSEHFHPTVHYIFSDDDTDIITEAALRSLDVQQDDQPGQKSTNKSPSGAQGSEDPVEGDKTSLLPPPIPGVREKYIIIDIEPVSPTTGVTQNDDQATIVNSTAEAHGGGSISTSPAYVEPHPASPAPSMSQPQYRIKSAKSFSSSWQILGSELAPAPTFEDYESGEAPGHGLMLKILGTEGLPTEVAVDQGDRETSRLEAMMDQFAKRMRELQMVIEAANFSPSPQEAPNRQERNADAAEPVEGAGTHSDGEKALTIEASKESY